LHEAANAIDSYRFFVAENKSANKIALSRHIFELF